MAMVEREHDEAEREAHESDSRDPVDDCGWRSADGMWICTRRSGHPGDHIASDGTEVCCRWPATPAPECPHGSPDGHAPLNDADLLSVFGAAAERFSSGPIAPSPVDPGQRQLLAGLRAVVDRVRGAQPPLPPPDTNVLGEIAYRAHGYTQPFRPGSDLANDFCRSAVAVRDYLATIGAQPAACPGCDKTSSVIRILGPIADMEDPGGTRAAVNQDAETIAIVVRDVVDGLRDRAEKEREELREKVRGLESDLDATGDAETDAVSGFNDAVKRAEEAEQERDRLRETVGTMANAEEHARQLLVCATDRAKKAERERDSERRRADIAEAQSEQRRIELSDYRVELSKRGEEVENIAKRRDQAIRTCAAREKEAADATACAEKAERELTEIKNELAFVIWDRVDAMLGDLAPDDDLPAAVHMAILESMVEGLRDRLSHPLVSAAERVDAAAQDLGWRVRRWVGL